MIWLKSWLLPTLAKIVIIFNFSAVIFHNENGRDIPPHIAEGIKKLLEFAVSWYPSLIMISMALLMGSFIARSISRGRPGFAYTVGRASTKLSMLTNFLFGAVLVPIVIASAFGFYNKTGLGATMFLGLTYIFLSAIIHWVGLVNTHPYAALTYVVTTGAGKFTADFRYKTAQRLADHITYCPYADSVEVITETDDYSITLVVPIQQEAKSLNQRDIEKWQLFISAIEAEWKHDGLFYNRISSPSLFSLQTPSAFIFADPAELGKRI